MALLRSSMENAKQLALEQQRASKEGLQGLSGGVIEEGGPLDGLKEAMQQEQEEQQQQQLLRGGAEQQTQQRRQQGGSSGGGGGVHGGSSVQGSSSGRGGGVHEGNGNSPTSPHPLQSPLAPSPLQHSSSSVQGVDAEQHQKQQQGASGSMSSRAHPRAPAQQQGSIKGSVHRDVLRRVSGQPQKKPQRNKPNTKAGTPLSYYLVNIGCVSVLQESVCLFNVLQDFARSAQQPPLYFKYKYTRIHTNTHSHLHAHAFTHTYTYTHAHTHIHTYRRVGQRRRTPSGLRSHTLTTQGGCFKCFSTQRSLPSLRVRLPSSAPPLLSACLKFTHCPGPPLCSTICPFFRTASVTAPNNSPT